MEIVFYSGRIVGQVMGSKACLSEVVLREFLQRC